MSDVVKHTKKAISTVHLLALLDTLKYVMLGGRIGKAKALVGSLLNVKPVLTLERRRGHASRTGAEPFQRARPVI